MTFADLALIPPLLRAIQEVGYTQPSPIQEQAIPPVLRGRDLIGCAQTGTGKTAAFALPILQRLSARPSKPGKPPIRALVLTPTRELAIQIGENFTAYGRYTPLRCCVIFGGVGQNPQVEALRRGVDILVATPGRLNDLIGQGHIDLQHIDLFVLDEADRMLDMGFIHDVRKVIARLPARRQTLLFSATMPREIVQLADSLLDRPVKVAVTPVSSTVDAIRQSLYLVNRSNKRALLIHLLKTLTAPSVLVFTRTKHGADRVARDLTRAGIEALAIHGNKSQTARQTALSRFKEGSLRVLVATDIAARGIDVEELALVIQFDLPNVPETYVHRIGRTGRAGMEGDAIAFCDHEEKSYWKSIEKLIGKSIPVVKDHPYPLQAEEPEPPAAATAQSRPKATSASYEPDRQPRSDDRRQASRRQSSVSPAPRDRHASSMPSQTAADFKPSSGKRRRRPHKSASTHA